MKIKFLFVAAFMALTQPVYGKTLVVGAPFLEFPALAAQILDGATAAVTPQWTIKPINAGCNEANARNTLNLLATEKPDAIVGFPCMESLDAALKKFGPDGIPFVTVASRAKQPSTLANKNTWPLFRVGPREGGNNEAIAAALLQAWQGQSFAIINDGAVFSQDTALAVKNKAEALGVPPVFFDSFQPQLENQKALISKLISSGATHVFIASDRSNVAQIALELGSNITVAGAENLLALDVDTPLPEGVLMVARDMSLDAAAIAKIAGARTTPFAKAEGYALDAYVATEIAMSLHQDPKQREFETASGLLIIESDGFALPASFALFRFDGLNFQKVAQ